jgi:hypothetical protein
LRNRAKIATIGPEDGGNAMMKAGWLAPALVAVAAACTQHPPGWDDAWAACQAEAIEAMEAADPDADQRSEWQDNYSNQCMDKKGFKVKSTI